MHNKEQMDAKQASFEQIAQAYGFLPIESKNPIMWSYENLDSEERMNYYHTTGTVTIQKLGWPIFVVKNAMTEIDFEDAITRKTAMSNVLK